MEEKNTKKLVFQMAMYSSASIIGPLLAIGLPGYLLDKYFNTKPIITIASVFVAFIVSNILLYRKTVLLTKRISKLGEEKKEGDSNIVK